MRSRERLASATPFRHYAGAPVPFWHVPPAWHPAPSGTARFDASSLADTGHWYGCSISCISYSNVQPVKLLPSFRTARQCSFRRRSHKEPEIYANAQHNAADSRPVHLMSIQHGALRTPGPAHQGLLVSVLRYAACTNSGRQSAERLLPYPYGHTSSNAL